MRQPLSLLLALLLTGCAHTGLPSPEDRIIYLSLGTGPGQTVRVPAAPGWQDVTLTLRLEPGVNCLRLCNDRGPMPDIDYLDLEPLR